MNPNADKLWPGPRWALAMLLALLGMLGPFSIDTYIPAFSGIAQSLGATPGEMQQTLSSYLFGFAFMNLFHGALADSFGRRPVVLWGMAIFTVASAGCALSQTIGQLVFFRALQGLSTGAGIVVSRAVIRDMFPPAQAQQVMSQVTIYFGVAPAIAPIVGGWLLVHTGWHSIFWFLTGVGVVLWAANYRFLPETLHVDQRQSFRFKNLMQGYWQLGSSPRFLLLALASGVPFNGMFLYVLSAPAFLGDLLHLAPTEFFWFFLLTISGIMSGAWLSGRLAGKIAPKQQIRHGFVIMLAVSLLNLVANWLFAPQVWWALIPIGLFAFGWALMVPVVTLLVLDLYPERRGMASSLQAFIGSTANGIVAGVLAPLVMHSALGLASASLLMMCVGLLAWVYLHQRWPEIGQAISSSDTELLGSEPKFAEPSARPPGAVLRTAAKLVSDPNNSPGKPNMKFLLTHPANFIALGFGSGLSPVAPGTAGTLWAWLAYLLLQPHLTAMQMGWLIVLSAFIGWWACTVAAKNMRIADPGSIVWDEVVAFWLVLWLVMPTGFYGQFAAFVLFRFFDAVKFGPMAWADKTFKGFGWRGGFGIMFDDFAAAFCTLLVIAIWRF